MSNLYPPSPYVESKALSDDMMMQPNHPEQSSTESGASYDAIGEQQTSAKGQAYVPDDLAGKPEC